MQRLWLGLSIGMLSLGLSWERSCIVADSPVWVAIYDHSDGSATGPKNLERFLTRQAGFRCERLHPEEIQAGRLAAFDVIIVPGGSGSKQAEKLGESGRETIRQFVKSGKGYVGICAGAYLASSDYTWSLNLLNAKVLDRAHWARGTGDVELKLSPVGRDLLVNTEPSIKVYYGQGPLLAPDDEADLPAYEPLAEYASEIAKKGAPSGVMIGTTAIARANYGAGRVMCFSPHPEARQATEHLTKAGVHWVAKKEPPQADDANKSDQQSSDSSQKTEAK